MEIITIVTAGTLTHKDSLGHTGSLGSGEVQAMSAGDGITHSEYNASPTEPLSLFQLWITPARRIGAARYAQASFPDRGKTKGPSFIAGPEGSGAALTIAQDAYVFRAAFDSKTPFQYQFRKEGSGLFVFVIEGSVEIEGETLAARDAITVSETNVVDFSTTSKADLLLIEVPL